MRQIVKVKPVQKAGRNDGKEKIQCVPKKKKIHTLHMFITHKN
jgi:hypothetical protein